MPRIPPSLEGTRPASIWKNTTSGHGVTSVDRDVAYFLRKLELKAKPKGPKRPNTRFLSARQAVCEAAPGLHISLGGYGRVGGAHVELEVKLPISITYAAQAIP